MSKLYVSFFIFYLLFFPVVSGGLCVQNSLHTSVSAPAGEKFRLRCV